MSVYYNVYAEANIDGKWYSLCPYFKDKNGIAKTHSIFWAQSVFTEVYYHLCDYVIGRGVPEDMSEGLREIFHEDLNEKVNGWHESITWGEYYRNTLIYVNFATKVLHCKKSNHNRFSEDVKSKIGPLINGRYL